MPLHFFSSRRRTLLAPLYALNRVQTAREDTDAQQLDVPSSCHLSDKRSLLRPAPLLLLMILILFLWISPLHAQQDPATVVHTVQQGETLSAIADQYGVTTDAILALNDFDDPDAIYAGQQLRIPTQPGAPAPEGTHRVQLGETLTSIAARYDLAVGQLMSMNGLQNPDELTAGQLLIVSTSITATPTTEPTAAPTAEPTATSTTEPTPAPTAAPPTPAATPTITSTPTVAPLPETHTVAAGETLTGIARRYGLDVDQLMSLNGLENPDELTEGQLLVVLPTITPTPTREPTITATITATTATSAAASAAATPESTATSLPPAATPTATVTPTAVALPATHTVAAGETLSGIARRYDLTIAALMSLNDLADPNAIRVGEVLQLTVAAPEDLTVVAPAPSPTAPVEQQATTASEAVAPATTPLPTPEIKRSGNPIASLNSTYTVRPGDSLGLIALRLGLDLNALAHLNGFNDTAPALNAGRTLLLPAVGDDLRTAPGAEAYVVKPGESLGQIAAAFDLTIGDLLSANRLADPNAIFPGERLLIPVRANGSGQNGAGFRQIGLPRSGYFYYTVQSGDTISALANQFNTTMQAIREYNNLPNNDSVYAGREIRIPYGVPTLARRLPPVPLSGTRFVVSISRQQCWAYHGERVAYSWDCSTGAGERRTKAGNYDVQSKILNAKSNIFRLDMPYWLGIYDVGPYENGVHGLPVDWDTGRKIWSGLIGQPATFGCAMLGDLDAATLYRMAFLGMPVHVVN